MRQQLSDSGKSFLLKDLVQNFSRIYGEEIGQLVIIYEIWQPQIYEKMIECLPEEVPVTTFQGLSKEVFSSLKASKGLTLVVFDDVATALLKKQFEDELNRLFIVTCHHFHVATVVLLQNVTFRTPTLSMLLNNSRYIYISFFDSSVPSGLCQTLQVGASGEKVYIRPARIHFRN